MPTRESGKQRASRIPLDYFKTGNALDRWKSRLGWLALIIPLWGAAGLLSGRANVPGLSESAYSRGPVTTVHATWDKQCDACHDSFGALSPDATWTAKWFGTGELTEKHCQKCHFAAPHYRQQLAEEIASCASCHAEHRGPEASLLEIADRHCTRCHANLTSHRMASTGITPLQNVTAFTDNRDQHPEFQLLRNSAPQDPGKLKFNHALHLRPGMARTSDDKSARPFTLGDIRDEADRKRFGGDGTNEGALVQLQCASCHQSEGAYMPKIVYEQHCRACHRLGFDPAVPELEIPHGLQPDQVKNFLWGAYANRATTQQATANDTSGETNQADESLRVFPGRNLRVTHQQLRNATAKNVESAEDFLYRKELATADKLIYSGKRICGECHHYEEPEMDDAQPPTFAAPKRIVAPNVPEIWFTHAKFDHHAHRGVTCIDCHQQAEKSETSGDLMLPGMMTCAKCHSPSQGSGPTLTGGARFHCTECHRYHPH